MVKRSYGRVDDGHGQKVILREQRRHAERSLGRGVEPRRGGYFWPPKADRRERSETAMGKFALVDVLKRIMRVEKLAQSRVVYGAALMVARNDKEDEELRATLQIKIAEYPKGQMHALKMLASHRDTFEEDRAYRLLKAAITDSPVAAVDSRSQCLFRREKGAR